MVLTEPPLEVQITILAATLHSPHFTSEVLRVLIQRLRHPEQPYTSKELRVLLLLTLAMQRAEMWP